MSARYIFRMDDITPGMDWDRFWSLLRLFHRHRVKPLLGIVPDNQDPKLNRRAPEPRFWDTMRLLVERDLVDIAQHGYQHTLEHHAGRALLKKTHTQSVTRSEFAGYSYQEQLSRIQKGQEILRQHNLETSYWFAPNHSFDRTTLHALRTAGFSAISDGIALAPYHHLGILCVPQQLWRPKWMPAGVFTVCLHSNTITTHEIREIRQFLRTPVHLTSFSAEVRSFRHRPMDNMCNSVFTGLYRGARSARRTLEWCNALRHSPATQPLQHAYQQPTDTDSISSQ